jgi:hypothetical protein
MYRLVVLTIVILGCNGQYNSGPIVQQKEVNGYAAPVAVAAPVQQSYGSVAVAAPVLASPVGYAAPVQQVYGPVDAAIQTRRTIEFRQVALQQDLAQPQIIEVPPNYESVQIHFRTASSPLSVSQSHSPAVVGPVEVASYQEGPHRLVNEIVKPVIQEVTEVIQPYRRIVQEIRPVIEEVHTIVNKGEKRAYAVPLPLLAPAAYGTGAAVFATKGYKAAKAA